MMFTKLKKPKVQLDMHMHFNYTSGYRFIMKNRSTKKQRWQSNPQ